MLPRLDAVSITAALGTVITKSAGLCCDGGPAIKAFARHAKVTFPVLPAPDKPLPEAWIMGAAGMGPYQQASR